MKKSRLVSFIIVITMLLISGVGNLGALLTSYAQDKNNLIITDISNEDSVFTLDNKFLLEQNIEKISDTQLKINLKIKDNNQDINIKNASLVNTVSDNFEIYSESVSVSGIQDSENAKGELTSHKDTVTINLVDITSQEVNVSFEVKIRDNTPPGQNLPLNLKAEIRYIPEDSEKEVVGSFPIPKVTLAEKENDNSLENNAIINPVSKQETISDANIKTTEKELKPEVDKKVEKIDDGIYEISLIVKEYESLVNIVSKDTDIILVMDSSGSMYPTNNNDYHGTMKKSIKSFVEDMLSNKNSSKRISVVDFSGPTRPSEDYYGGGGINGKLDDAQTIISFSSNIKEINDKVDATSAKENAYTNIDAAFRRVKEELYKSIKDKPEANRHVIFFTDGLPTTSSLEGRGNGSKDDPKWGWTLNPDLNSTKLEEDYKKSDYFGNPIYYKSPIKAAVETYNSIKGIDSNEALKETNVYNILFENHGQNPNLPKVVDNLFGSIQGTEIDGVYKRIGGKINDGNNYSTKNINNLEFIYDKIQQEITSSILLNNATITDIVTDEFEILENQYVSDGSSSGEKTMTSIVTNLKTGEVINLPNDQPSLNGNTISWDVGEISPEGILIKFRIKVKDDYFGGTKIPTNKEAKLTYTDANGSIKDMLFPVPNVDIPYIKGSINIKKEIVKKDELGEWVKVEDSKVNLNDRFSISVVGSQKYTVDLKGNNQSSMSFYLKGENTDITNNNDYSLNYFTVGAYSIEEIVPMNYEQVQIWIDKTPNLEEDNWVKFEDYVSDKENIDSGKVKDGKIVIDKGNKNINIKVTNTLVNDNYWQDKSDSINKFDYKPISK